MVYPVVVVAASYYCCLCLDDRPLGTLSPPFKCSLYTHNLPYRVVAAKFCSSDEVRVFRIGVACLRAWSHSCSHRCLSLVFDSHGDLLLAGSLESRLVFHGVLATSITGMVVALRRHLPRFARLVLRGGPSVCRTHMLARIPVNGVAMGSCRIVHRLGVIAMCRVAKLVHNVTGTAATVRLDKLVVVVPLLLCRLHVVLGRAYFLLATTSDSCVPIVTRLVVESGVL